MKHWESLLKSVNLRVPGSSMIIETINGPHVSRPLIIGFIPYLKIFFVPNKKCTTDLIVIIVQGL